MVYLSKGSFLKLQWSAVGQSEGIISDARYARQIQARRWWRHILNRGSMEEMKVNDVVDFQPIAKVYHQLLIKYNSKISGIPLKRVFFKTAVVRGRAEWRDHLWCALRTADTGAEVVAAHSQWQQHGRDEGQWCCCALSLCRKGQTRLNYLPQAYPHTDARPKSWSK